MCVCVCVCVCDYVCDCVCMCVNERERDLYSCAKREKRRSVRSVRISQSLLPLSPSSLPSFLSLSPLLSLPHRILRDDGFDGFVVVREKGREKSGASLVFVLCRGYSTPRKRKG